MKLWIKEVNGMDSSFFFPFFFLHKVIVSKQYDMNMYAGTQIL